MVIGATTAQSEKFIEVLLDNLEFALDGMDASFVLGWVQENFEPEDVFDEDILIDWAENNEFIRE